jgi:hypothetical protein
MISPLRFSSKIKFVSYDEFHRLPCSEMNSRGEYAAAPWSIKDRVIDKPRGYTDGAYTCNAGGFHNGEKLVLFHLIPHRNIVDFKKEVAPLLKKDLSRLAKEGAPVRGFISGGDPTSESSSRLFNKLKKLFQDMGIPFSVLWGQETGGPLDIYYNTREDTWVVHTLGKSQDVLTLQDIESNFRHRYLDPGDTLEVGGKTYNADEIIPTLTPETKQKKRRFWFF